MPHERAAFSSNGGKVMQSRLLTNRPIVLKNTICCYCGQPLDTPTADHVIGRRFVPKGTLNNAWNLIVQACRPCNNHKSDLEDDISAITMQPDVTGNYVTDDPILIAEAQRKARSTSRRTGKPVSESSATDTLHMTLGPATCSFGIIGPPQVADERAWDLAYLHLAAFFFCITYNEEHARGGFLPGAFQPLPTTPRKDWGNCLQRSFMQHTREWLPRLIGTTASDYFKIAIKRHPDRDVWSFALEWNRALRVSGFFGEVYEPGLAWPQAIPILRDGEMVIRMREEIPLDPTNDTLFAMPAIEPTDDASAQG